MTGNLRITGADTDSDTRHLILDFGTVTFPVLEGQSIGVVPPGVDAAGKPYAMRLYSIASPRDGERPNTNNLSLTVKRVEGGVASNWLCDLKLGESINVIGPFGATFLMPDDQDADILMICTGTGAAPSAALPNAGAAPHPRRAGNCIIFRRADAGGTALFRSVAAPAETLLNQELVYSRLPGAPKEYVQDRMRKNAADIAALLGRPQLHIYMCGLKGLETGVEAALAEIGPRPWH